MKQKTKPAYSFGEVFQNKYLGTTITEVLNAQKKLTAELLFRHTLDSMFGMLQAVALGQLKAEQIGLCYHLCRSSYRAALNNNPAIGADSFGKGIFGKCQYTWRLL